MQRGADLMAHRGEELALGEIGAIRLLLGLTQFSLCAFQLAQVGRLDDEVFGLPLEIPGDRDAGERPDEGAVLADIAKLPLKVCPLPVTISSIVFFSVGRSAGVVISA